MKEDEMGRLPADKLEREAVRTAAAMMAVSARTAPKAMGIDNLKTMVVDGDDLGLLAEAMEAKAEEQPAHLSPIFVRDAANVRGSSCVLLIGVSGNPKRIEKPLDCGACGYGGCQRLLNAKKRPGKDFTGPVCIVQAIDLGIALGSAAKLAGELGVDNRIMYTVGAGAKKLGLLDSDVIIGIPLSAAGKNIYFDRR
jgi:uncharacterized ferredoxin-like protein